MTKNSWKARMMGLQKPIDPKNIPDEEETIILVQGKNTFGDEIYCYLKLAFKNYYLIQQKLAAKEKFDLKDYGEVVAAGLGEPTPEVRAEMDNMHGMVTVALASSEDD